MGIPWWRVSHLSDIPYLLNNDVQAGGDNSPAQRRLSALLSGSAAAFAHTANPTESEGEVLKEWPEAYEGQSKEAMKKEFPEDANVYVVGGTFGSGSAAVSKEVKEGSSPREKAVEWEKVLQRCEFINSILDEVSV